MKANKFVLGLCISMLAIGSHARAMESEKNVNSPGGGDCAGTSRLTTGTMHDVNEENTSKRMNRYKLFISQMEVSKRDELEKETIECIDSIINFFKYKVEQTKDAQDGKPEKSADHALYKYLAYSKLSEFISGMEIAPPSLNPIIFNLIKKYVEKLESEYKDLKSFCEEKRSNLTATQQSEFTKYFNGHPLTKFTVFQEDTTFVNLDGNDNLHNYAKNSMEKWREKLNKNQIPKASRSKMDLSEALAKISKTQEKG